ncbi:MAG: enoyl-CoA hydratase-related protein [Bernardetiaceae bacterium]|jgi:methylglutaconyl-CoA hydratase|nr:enoyl-CoA hydratase-related protein [Bernardetiaceae bacterium]
METLLYHTHERVAYLTLNRPEKRNAFNAQLVAELAQAFAQAQADEQVRVVVLQAHGPVFCAGADLAFLQSLQTATPAQNLADSRAIKNLYQQIYQLPKPVIAAVQGHALAGGCGLATVCDLVLAVPEAKFGYTEVKIGFVPAIVMVFLVRKLGEARARQLLLTADLVPAPTAQAWGLVTELVAPEQLMARTQQLARQLATGNSGQALAATKQLLAQVQDLPLEAALELAAQTNAQARAFPDCQRGVAAFLNKTPLEW